jgi:hypothetical protein
VLERQVEELALHGQQPQVVAARERLVRALARDASCAKARASPR